LDSLNVQNGYARLEIITGVGNNSEAGVSVLKPTVVQLLSQYNIPFDRYEGAIVAKIKTV
jgi:hypothetical protein